MGLRTELEELRGLIESAKGKPLRRMANKFRQAEEKIRRQKRDFETSRDQKIRELKELQEKIMAIAGNSIPLMATIGAVAGGIYAVIDSFSSLQGTWPVKVAAMFLLWPAMLILAVIVAIVGGVAGLLVGGLLYGVGEIAHEGLTSSIESLEKQTWKPSQLPQSTPKDLLPH